MYDDEDRRLFWERGVMKTDRLPGELIYDDVVRILRSNGLLPDPSLWVPTGIHDLDDDVAPPAPPSEIPRVDDDEFSISAMSAPSEKETLKMNMNEATYRETGIPQPQTRHIPTKRELLIRNEEALHRRIDKHKLKLGDLRNDVKIGVCILILLGGVITSASYITGWSGQVVGAVWCVLVVAAHLWFRSRHGG